MKHGRSSDEKVTRGNKRYWNEIWKFWELKRLAVLKGLAKRLHAPFVKEFLATPATGTSPGESDSSVFTNFLLTDLDRKCKPLLLLWRKPPPWVLKGKIQLSWKIPLPLRSPAKPYCRWRADHDKLPELEGHAKRAYYAIEQFRAL